MKIHIVRDNDEIDVLLLKNKEEDTYSFVNITKGHICPCKFTSINSAIDDLIKYKNIGKIISFKVVN